MMGQLPEEVADGLSTKELECKICYFAYNLSSRRPKVLECCHRLCSKCLVKILSLGESPPNSVVCPLCRCITGLPGEASGSLLDDYNLVTMLPIRNQYMNIQGGQGEILLNPGRLNSLVGHSALASPTSVCSSYVVITIVESTQEHDILADHRSSSQDSISSVTQCCTVWNCTMQLCQASARLLMWLLGMLYFSSLPTGVYLLIIQKTTLGILLISLVPVSLLMIMIMMCQSVCHEIWDCVPP